MKKLICLLGAVTLLSTSGAVLVSCKHKTNYHKLDGNSVIAKFIDNIDGKTEITSLDLLERLYSDPAIRKQMDKDLLSLMNLSFLANVDKFKNVTEEKNGFFFKDLIDILKDRFSTLEQQAQQKINDEKDKYKKDDKKKWKENWKKYLAGKFPQYQDDADSANIEKLEKKYKYTLLIDDTNNVTSTLKDVLLSTDQLGVSWVTKQTVINNLNQIKSWSSAEIATYLSSNDKKPWVSQIINATKTTSEGWINTYDSTYFDKDKNVKADVVKNAMKNIQEGDIKADNVPFDTTKLKTDDASTRGGFLSNSQRYFLNQYYQTNAPVAVSEIIFGFADGYKFEDGITADSFTTKSGADKEEEKIVKFMNDMFAGSNSLKDDSDYDTSIDTKWNGILTNSNLTDKYGSKISAKKNSKLLTLNSAAAKSSSLGALKDDNKSTDYTQMIKNSIYDYLDKKKDCVDLKADAKAKDFNLATVIGKINRQASSTVKNVSDDVATSGMYGELAPGKLAFVEDDGLHIVSIDGYKYWIDSKTKKADGSIKSYDGNGTIDSDNLEQLRRFKQFYTLDDTKKVEAIQNHSSNEDALYNTMNKSISNPYLHYLVNNSLIKDKTGSITSYDIIGETKEWASSLDNIGDETSNNWALGYFDYFKNLMSTSTKGLRNSDNDTFYNEFISFGDKDKDKNNEYVQIMKDDFDNSLVTINTKKRNHPIVTFRNANKSWTDTINKQTKKTYPKRIFTNEFAHNDIFKMCDDKWWWTTSSNASYLTMNYYSNELVKGGN